jgi:hypothetical protein
MYTQTQMASLADALSSGSEAALQEAFAVFNALYFEGRLPEVPLQYKRRKNDYGQLSCTWKKTASGKATEAQMAGGLKALQRLMFREPFLHVVPSKLRITINPDLCVRREIPYLLTTLLHEMVHLEQVAVRGVWSNHDNAFNCRYLGLEGRLLQEYGHQIVQK